MKKLSYLSLALILSITLFTSCKDDDEVSPSSSELIIGEWTGKSIELSFTIDGKDFFDYLKELETLTEEQIEALQKEMEEEFESVNESTWTLNEDGSYVIQVKSVKDTGEWSLIDDNKTLQMKTLDFDFTSEYTIISLTSDQLTLNLKETETEDYNGDGEDEVLIISATYSLKK